MEENFDLRTYLRIAKRRYMFFLVPTVVVFFIICLVAYFLPPTYQATARILVESQQIPTDLARPTVTAAAVERIQVIQQRLMTRDNLLQIARKFGLYNDSYIARLGEKIGFNLEYFRRRSPSDIVDIMRDAAKIEQIDTKARRDSQAIAFAVSFDYGDPTTAARVANEFVSLILQQNIQSRTNRASETYKFFEQQVGTLRQQLVSVEENITRFKGENQGALPESLVFRQSLSTQLQAEIAEIDRKIGTLENEKGLWSQRAQSTGIGTDLNANTSTGELDRLRLQLVQLRAVYSEAHPDVRRTRAQVQAMANAAASEANGKMVADAGSKQKVSEFGIPSLNPHLASQLALIDRQIEALQSQRAGLQARVTSLAEAILKAPQVEVALNALTREHNTLQTQLGTARAKMAEAATGERLEEDRQSERFEIIEQATPPTEPAKPDRYRIVLGGLFFSFAVGVGIVVLLEMLDKSIRTSADLEKQLQQRPLAIVPYVMTRMERRRRKLKVTGFFALSATSVVAALILVHVFYSPLQLLIQKVIPQI